ncbi:MAG: glycosyltransferase family 4 protein [Patescibacteria group bacterium]|jgi:glycosyltransferase involved in cell wall biosynthesis
MDKKIKILFAIDYFAVGGAPLVVLNQINGLNKGLFDPYILVLYKTEKPTFFAELNFGPDKIFQMNLKNRRLFDYKTWRMIFKILKREKFDVVYTHLFLTNLIVRSLAILVRVPVIISFEHSSYSGKHLWQIFIDKILSFFTNRIIVSTKSVAEFTARQEKISIKKFVVIANPVILPKKNEFAISELRKKLNLPLGSFVVMTLGRFSEEKGLEYFLQAAKIISPLIKNVYFLLVGYGGLQQKLRQKILELELEDKCSLVIDPQHAKEYLYISDLFVLPSLREGQSIVTYEAMTAGLPVIASRLDSLTDIIDDGRSGVLVEPKDSDAIAEKIIYLYQNPAIRQKYSEAGKEKTKEYNLERNIKEFEILIKNLIQKQ